MLAPIVFCIYVSLPVLRRNIFSTTSEWLLHIRVTVICKGRERDAVVCSTETRVAQYIGPQRQDMVWKFFFLMAQWSMNENVYICVTVLGYIYTCRSLSLSMSIMNYAVWRHLTAQNSEELAIKIVLRWQRSWATWPIRTHTMS